jgi:hypothetical protein
VHRGAHSGSQVGGAEGEEAQTVIVGEGHALLNVVDSSHQTTVDLTKITTHLHGDEAHVIFLIAPDQEGLVLIVEDTTSNRPVAASVGGLKIYCKTIINNQYYTHKLEMLSYLRSFYYL